MIRDTLEDSKLHYELSDILSQSVVTKLKVLANKNDESVKRVKLD
jgi:hypothetical protein